MLGKFRQIFSIVGMLLLILLIIIMPELSSTFCYIFILISFPICYLLSEKYGLIYYIIIFLMNFEPQNLSGIVGFDPRLRYPLSILFITIFFIHRVRKQDLKIKDNYFYLILLFLIILLASVFSSYYIKSINSILLFRGDIFSFTKLPIISSFLRVLFIFCLIITSFIIHYYSFVKKQLINIIKTHIYISSGISAISLLSWFISLININFLQKFTQLLIVKHEYSPPRIKATFGEPLFFSLYLMTTLPLLLALLFSEQKIFDKKTLHLMIIIQTSSFILTFSRSALLGLLFMFATIIIFNLSIIISKIGKYIKIYKGITTIFCFLIISSLFFTIFTENMVKEQFEQNIIGAVKHINGKFYSTLDRLTTYKYGMIAFKKHPFFGIGYNNIRFYSSIIYISWVSGNIDTWAVNEIHNIYLRFLTEFGVVGFLIILYSGLTIIRLSLRSIKYTNNNVLKNLNIGFLAGSFGLFAEYLFYSNITYIFIWFYLGLMLASVEFSMTKKSNDINV